LLLIIPKASSSLYAQCYTRTIAAILSLSKIILSLYSRYIRKGLVYIALASPLSRQLSSYLEYTKANIRFSYDVYFTFNAKYTHPITLNSL